MSRTPILAGAPSSAPYSPAIVAAGPLVFVSGQLPIDAASGRLCTGAFAEQAELVLGNITRLLALAGSDWSRVVKWSVFLADLRDYAELNAVALRHLVAPYPARTTVQVVLPPGVGLEVECVALVGP
ncbi:MAG: RidA family protein [Myxococcales bacterium]|nr:RidA family protein [Myxococcales bacterium]